MYVQDYSEQNITWQSFAWTILILMFYTGGGDITMSSHPKCTIIAGKITSQSVKDPGIPLCEHVSGLISGTDLEIVKGGLLGTAKCFG